MANNPDKIKFFIGTPSQVEKLFNDWILEGGYTYSNVNMAGTADKIVVSVIYRRQERGLFY